MAISATFRLAEVSDGPGTASYTTASFTPSSNALLCVAIYAKLNGNDVTFDHTDLTISDSVGLTWSRQVGTQANTVNVTGWTVAVTVFTAPVGTAASMTITVDAGAFDVALYAVHAADHTGYDTAAPIGSTVTRAAEDTSYTGPLTITLPSAPNIASAVFAGVFTSSASNITVGTGWTELGRIEYFSNLSQTQSRIGSVSSDVTWDDVSVFESDLEVALEIKAAQGASVWLLSPIV